MTPTEWESWHERYPEERNALIEPLQRDISQ
jgi:hypothetical protein